MMMMMIMGRRQGQPIKFQKRPIFDGPLLCLGLCLSTSCYRDTLYISPGDVTMGSVLPNLCRFAGMATIEFSCLWSRIRWPWCDCVSVCRVTGILTSAWDMSMSLLSKPSARVESPVFMAHGAI
jgi:hypothetical protein